MPEFATPKVVGPSSSSRPTRQATRHSMCTGYLSTTRSSRRCRKTRWAKKQFDTDWPHGMHTCRRDTRCWAHLNKAPVKPYALGRGCRNFDITSATAEKRCVAPVTCIPQRRRSNEAPTLPSRPVRRLDLRGYSFDGVNSFGRFGTRSAQRGAMSRSGKRRRRFAWNSVRRGSVKTS